MDAFIAAQKKKRDIALGVFLGSSAAFGVADLLLYRSEGWTSTSWVLDAIIGYAAIVAWCIYDSHVQTFRLTGGLRLLTWFLPLVGVPVYLVRSRGWIGALKVAFGLMALLLSVGLYYAGWYGSYWIARRAGYFQP